MSDLTKQPDLTQETPHWTARFGKPIIFVILTLIAVGAYLALSIPVSVFPETDFPRIVVGIDNGVFPIDQMLVTITRPIEEAVNTVPGLQSLWSVTSRGTAVGLRCTCMSSIGMALDCAASAGLDPAGVGGGSETLRPRHAPKASPIRPSSAAAIHSRQKRLSATTERPCAGSLGSENRSLPMRASLHCPPWSGSATTEATAGSFAATPRASWQRW